MASGFMSLCCIISLIIDKQQHSFIFSESVEECVDVALNERTLKKRWNQTPSTPSSFAWHSRRCTILLKSLSTSGTFEFLRFGTSFHILTYFILLCPTEIQRNANLFRTNHPITLLFSWRWPDHERKNQTRNESCLTDDRSPYMHNGCTTEMLLVWHSYKIRSTNTAQKNKLTALQYIHIDRNFHTLHKSNRKTADLAACLWIWIKKWAISIP